MKIKQLLLLAIVGVMALASCQKDPSTSGLDNEYLVYTAHDASADFSAIGTYYIPDSILLIGSHAINEEGEKVSKYWKDADAMTLINTIVSQLNALGYARITDGALRTSADVGLQPSYVEQSTYFVGYNDPYWWGYYPYYWMPSYWGPWYGWYYPFSVYYGYTTGSLLVEMVDLNSESGSGKSLPILWNAYISGLIDGNNRFETAAAVEALEQAFAQSPYLKK